MKIQQWISTAVIALFSLAASNVLAGPDQGGKQNSSTAPKLSLLMDSCNCASVCCSGTPGRKCIVEATTCLCPPTWVAISTNTLSGNGTCTFKDQNAGKYNHRFYRLVMLNSSTGGNGGHHHGNNNNGDKDDQGDDQSGGH